MTIQNIFDLPLAAAVLSEENSWIYYVICAVFFTLCGLASGYFVWRKGNMQMHDAELEVARTNQDLHNLQSDLREEEKGLRLESENKEVEEIVPQEFTFERLQ